MHSLQRTGWFTIVLLLVMLAAPQSAAPETFKQPSRDASDTVVIRVGITEYQDLEETYAKYLDFFQELTSQFQKQSNNRPLNFKFRIAVGSYEEVKDCHNTSLI